MSVQKEHCDKFWVVGVPRIVFSEDPQLSLKTEFESIFRAHSDYVQFNYMKALGRALVIYPDEETGHKALLSLKNVEFHGINLILHPVKPVTIGERRLSLPASRVRNFFISPPASPPVGWEPIDEDPPVVDYNLIAALSQLRAKGEPQEVISATNGAPSIIISCEDDYPTEPVVPRQRIASLPTIDVQTRYP